jgi:hypothetical protein
MAFLVENIGGGDIGNFSFEIVDNFYDYKSYKNTNINIIGRELFLLYN